MFSTMKISAIASLALIGGMSLGFHSPASAAEKSSSASTASGQLLYDCLLLPFNSAFRYEGPVTVKVAAPASAGASVKVTANFPKLPGIAPLDIENGTMSVKVIGTLGGEKLELKGNGKVNEVAKAPVTVPTLRGTIKAPKSGAAIELTTFTFAFGELLGLDITAQCDAARGMKVSALNAKGAKEEDGNTVAADVVSTTPEDGNGTLLTGVLWGAPVLAAAAGLLFWLQRRRRRNA